MKPLLILLFWITILTDSYSQNSFQMKISTINDDWPSDFVMMPDGGFIMSYISRPDYTSSYTNHFIRVNKQGEITSQDSISNPNGSCIIYNMLLSSGGNIIGVGQWQDQDGNNELWYTCIDTMLTIHWNKKYVINGNRIFRTHSIINLDGNIISGAHISPSQSIFDSGLLFIETTSTGDTIRTKYHYPGGFHPIYDFIKQGDYYKALAIIDDISLSDIVSMDSVFNVISTSPVPYQISNCMTAKPITDTTMYVSGCGIYGAADSDIGIIKISDPNTLIFENHIGKIGDTVDYGGADRSMDFIDKNHIFLAGTSNIDLYYGTYSAMPSWYVLSSLDSMLNVRWVKYYYGDACYVLRSVVATADGGAILTGSRYDYKDPANKLDIYILKVNQDGIYTSVDDPVVVSHDAIIYPNPGGDYFNIQSGPQIDGAWFVLYDMQGKALIEQNIHSTHLRIDTARLPYGTYPWQIVYKGKVIESGKWVKG